MDDQDDQFNELIAAAVLTIVSVVLVCIYLCIVPVVWFFCLRASAVEGRNIPCRSNSCRGCYRHIYVYNKVCCTRAIFIIGTILWLFCIVMTAITWPRRFTQSYEGESYQLDPSTLRLEAVRTGIHAGMLHRVDYDCEDQISAHEASSVTIENGMKWKKLAKSSLDVRAYDWGPLDLAVDRVRAASQRLRGHALVWDSLEVSTPPPLIDAIDSSSNKTLTARSAMRNHFNAIMRRYNDSVTVWDVVNEPIKGNPPRVSGEFEGPLFKALGELYIDEAFAIAREIADEVRPDTKLFLNEAFGDDYELDSPFIIEFLSLLDRLQARNVSIDCVGIQGHSFFGVPAASSLRKFVQEILNRNLCIEFTEVDARLRVFEENKKPYESQGDAIGEYYRICAELGQDKCLGVTTWGISDITAWYDAFLPFQFNRVNDPFLFDINGRRKPAWREAFLALQTAPNISQVVPSSPQVAPSESTRNVHTCTGDDLIYTLNQGWYFASLVFSVFMTFFLLVVFLKLRSYDRTTQKDDEKGAMNTAVPDSNQAVVLS